jgi:hypothetical protein
MFGCFCNRHIRDLGIADSEDLRAWPMREVRSWSAQPSQELRAGCGHPPNEMSEGESSPPWQSPLPPLPESPFLPLPGRDPLAVGFLRQIQPVLDIRDEPLGGDQIPTGKSYCSD